MRKVIPFHFYLSSSKEALLHHYQIRRNHKQTKKKTRGEKLTFVLLTLGNKHSLEFPFIFPLHFCQVTEQNKYPTTKKSSISLLNTFGTEIT